MFGYTEEVDATEKLPAWQLTDGEVFAGLLAADQDFSRVYARILDFVAEVDKRGLAVENGFRDAVAMIERILRVSRKEAKARVAQATADLPLVRKALETGEINREHAREIEHILSQAPDSVSKEDLAANEAVLVDLSQQAS